MTSDGLMPIEEVPVGALVASWNPVTDTVAFETVTGKSSRMAPGVLNLTVRDEAGRVETVRVTPNHPYLVAANDNELPPVTASATARGGILDIVRMDPKGYWTAAGFFKPGQKIKSASGKMIEVVSSTLDPTPTRVYTFEIDKNQSYAVGELGAWAHNAVPRGSPFLGKPGSYQSKIPGKRVRCNSKKCAYERAKLACDPGYEPENDGDHYHPRGPNAPPHDHYYFPK